MAWLRFHIPLIEPDVRIARIRLSDKNSRLHPRHVVPKPAQAYESEVPVEEACAENNQQFFAIPVANKPEF